MPRVPTYDSFQATPNTLPQAFAKTPDIPIDPGAPGKEMGAALTQAGDATSKIAMDMAEQANQTRLDDTSMQLREYARTQQYGQQNPNNPSDPNNIVGYSQIKGKDALVSPDGTSLADKYGKNLDDKISELSNGLGNEAQRAAFTRYANGFSSAFKDSVWQHTIREQTNYHVSVAEGLHDEAVQNIKDNYRNPYIIDNAIATIGEQTNALGRLKGLSDPQINQSRLKSVSTALKTGVEAYQAEGDAVGAAAFYDKYKSQITMDDALVVSKQIKTGLDTHVGINAGQVAYNQARQPAAAQVAFNAMTATVTDMFNKGVVQTESSNAPGVVTHLNKNGTTDYGPGQLNEKTGPEAAKLAGVPWDLEKLKTDPNYGRALSLALFQDKYTKNGNDLSLAIADYHAPARTQDAVKAAQKSGGNWLDHVDDELRTYVTKTVDNYNRAASKPPKEMTMAEVEGNLAKMKLSPEQLVKARAEGEYQIKNYNAQIKAQTEGSISNALDAAKQNQVPFEKLPLAIQNAVPSDKICEVKDKIKKILDTGDVATDYKMYAGLRDEAVTDPGNFKKRDLSTSFSYLAEPQRKELIDLQAKMKDPAQATHVVELNSQLAIAHNQLGFIGTTFGTEKGKLDSAVTQAIAAESAQKGGRELDYTERQKIIDRMLLPATRPSNIWFGGSTKRMYEVYGTQDQADYKPDISDNDHAMIKKALIAEGKDPTQENIMARYNRKYGL